jgi:hypothetical protein
MTSFNKRVYEMLVRVQVFSTTYPQLFQKGSPTGQLLEEIESAVQTLSAHNASLTSGKWDAKRTTGERALASAILRGQLDTISRTARGLMLGQFWMSRDRSDRSLVEMGQIFGSRAEPLQQAFIDSHMPPDFLEKLNAAVRNLEKTIRDQVLREGARLAASSAIEKTLNSALSTLEGLDPMVENLLRDDPPALTVWQSARHVERYTRSRRVEPDAAAAAEAAAAAAERPPVVPITPTDAALQA